MDVTWKLKPNLTWHDGAPLTADDFVFGMQVYQDKDVPLAPRPEIRLIGAITAPDSQTLVVHWKETYADANVGDMFVFPAVPRHILGDLYAGGDKQAFLNSPYWARQFVGVGPYRLGEYSRETLIVTDQWHAGGLDAAPYILSQDDADLDR